MDEPTSSLDLKNQLEVVNLIRQISREQGIASVMAMHDLNLALSEDRPVREIDVGGCHGAYSVALAQCYPRLHATIFELPRVVPVACRIVAEVSMADRARVQAGDLHKDELGRVIIWPWFSGYSMANHGKAARL